MEHLTFGEQVKIVLGRKGMTIKELAQIIEERTGKKMSRQNLTQRLGRDNFQEQDMRTIASILGCPFHLSIMDEDDAVEVKAATEPVVEEVTVKEPEEVTLEETVIDEPVAEEVVEDAVEEVTEEVVEEPAEEEPAEVRKGGTVFLRRQVEPSAAVEKEEKHEKAEVHHEKHDDSTFEPIVKRNDEEENREVGDLNPYTGKEYQSNSVRMHPTRIGYIQVYDRKDHKWTDMTEWAFLGYQEREKIRLGDDYEPPIYLD